MVTVGAKQRGFPCTNCLLPRLCSFWSCLACTPPSPSDFDSIASIFCPGVTALCFTITIKASKLTPLKVSHFMNSISQQYHCPNSYSHIKKPTRGVVTFLRLNKHFTFYNLNFHSKQKQPKYQKKCDTSLKVVFIQQNAFHKGQIKKEQPLAYHFNSKTLYTKKIAACSNERFRTKKKCKQIWLVKVARHATQRIHGKYLLTTYICRIQPILDGAVVVVFFFWLFLSVDCF